MEDARSDSFETSRVEGRLKELQDKVDALELTNEEPTPLEVPKKGEPKNRAERRAAKRKMKGSCPLRLV